MSQSQYFDLNDLRPSLKVLGATVPAVVGEFIKSHIFGSSLKAGSHVLAT